MTTLRAALLLITGLVLGFAAVTWAALEVSGVAIVETRAPDGSLRQTHVWWIEQDGELWVEAGSPENPWFQDVQVRPELQLWAGDHAGLRVAVPVPEPAARTLLRARLRARYGWRDAWVALLFDTSRSVAVRLDPVTPGSDD